ncbi:hypothetical protein ACG7TL_005404 [Trametes sanguinea]
MDSPSASPRESEKGALEGTQTLDEEFLHADFLKYARTIATEGTRPSDPYTADLVTTLLNLAKLSARIACEITWDNVTHTSPGLLNARKDLNHSFRRVERQLECTLEAGEHSGHRFPTTALKPSSPPMLSELVTAGTCSLETARDWASPGALEALRTTLLERLKPALYDTLLEDLEASLSTSLEKHLLATFSYQLRLPLTEALQEPLFTALRGQLERRIASAKWEEFVAGASKMATETDDSSRGMDWERDSSRRVGRKRESSRGVGRKRESSRGVGRERDNFRSMDDGGDNLRRADYGGDSSRGKDYGGKSPSRAEGKRARHGD